jgi:hypothetical protein
VEHGKTDIGAFLRSRSRGGVRFVETNTTTIDHENENGSSSVDENNEDNNDENDEETSSSLEPPPSSHVVFSATAEWTAMANLAWPLAVSFFCRMGMASTDSAFVGHIHDQHRYVYSLFGWDDLTRISR